MNNPKYLEIIKKFTLLDDTFMTAVFNEDTRLTEIILRIILDKDDLHVLEVHTQTELPNLHGRSARLDVFAVDSSGRKYDIEVQRSDSGATVRRARYYSSLIDANALDTGEHHDRLVDTYVIFITENDILGDGLPLYTIQRFVKETGKPVNDGTHILYVNNSVRDETPLGRLMADFACVDPADMHNRDIAEKVKFFKQDREGVTKMCKLMDDLVREEAERYRMEGIAEGTAKEKINTARRLLALGDTIEKVAKGSDLSIDEVKALLPA